MDLFSDNGYVKVWNYCHPSGHCGRVEEVYHEGLIVSRIFTVNRMIHRDVRDGPAYEHFDSRGKHTHKAYHEDGLLHRPTEDGPAGEWYVDGTCTRYEFRNKGKLHRPLEEGPALFWIYGFNEYWVDGELIKVVEHI